MYLKNLGIVASIVTRAVQASVGQPYAGKANGGVSVHNSYVVSDYGYGTTLGGLYMSEAL